MKEKQPVENGTHVTPDTECNLPASDNATSDDTEPFNIDDEEEAVTTTAFNEHGVEQAENNEQSHPHSTNLEAGQITWGRSRRTRFVSHRRLVAEEEGNPALRRAYAAKSPCGLVVSMPTRMVQNHHRVPIPRQWFVTCISKRISHKVILRVKNEERTWVVPVYFCESETGRTRPVELMRSGWKPFAADNRIKEFDACLFEPAGRNHLGIPIIDVVIEREDPTMPILPPSTDSDAGKSREENRQREIWLKAVDAENNIALQQARAEEIPGISKVVAIYMSHVSRSFRVRMSLEWISKHLSEQSMGARKVLLSMDMQMQQVLLHFNETYKYAELTAGWKEFACYHSLNVSDVCLFNPAGTRNNDGISIINVRIFRNGPERQNR
ncbi:hypothetical protein SLEP1_g59957 [Rubroshorea leprosula]|uniref:TF-B3 domain-containing protein n=1 Tax=Rubroshorea leprosula TaxID=152421 RepID=A0AAV5MTW3_9ROSI|nr:hypothetical protein SLEP1_g59957 [Rubroshorea leprosula]